MCDLSQKSDHSHPDNYFRRFLAHYGAINPELWEKAFRPIEENLRRLDLRAWQHLRDKTLPCVTSRCARRGHDKLFNYLDEARGYVLLADRGHKGIHFIEIGRGKSPDLRGELEGSTTILEVKSINRSEDDIGRLATGKPEIRDVLFGISDKFRKKLLSTIAHARVQLAAFAEPSDRKIILLVVRWDSDYMLVPENHAALASFINSISTPEVEIIHQIAF